jgi:hypothetical protein
MRTHLRDLPRADPLKVLGIAGANRNPIAMIRQAWVQPQRPRYRHAWTVSATHTMTQCNPIPETGRSGELMHVWYILSGGSDPTTFDAALR